MQIDDDSIMLYKLVTGELIIGILDRDLTQDSSNSDVLFIRHPAIIGITQDSLYLVKYNQFSKLNLVMIMGRNVVYVDIPDEKIISHYRELLIPKVPKSKVDDEGTEHSIH